MTRIGFRDEACCDARATVSKRVTQIRGFTLVSKRQPPNYDGMIAFRVVFIDFSLSRVG